MSGSVRKRRYQSWSGTRADLQRILDRMETLLEQGRAARLETIESRHEKHEARIRGWIADDEKDLASDRVRNDPAILDSYRKSALSNQKMLTKEQEEERIDRSRHEEAWSIKLEFTERGGSEEVLAYRAAGMAETIDPRSVRSFSLKAPAGYEDGSHNYRIEFYGSQAGLHLEVRGPDRNFTSSAIEMLGGEIAKGTHWWGHLRNFAITFPLGFMVFYYAIFAAQYRPESTGGTLPLILSTTFAALGVAALVGFLSRVAIPEIQVLDDNRKARGSGALLFLTPLILSIPIGLLVNHLG